MNRNRPERRSGAATRFARRDLPDQGAGGFEHLLFKPPPNGRIFRCEAASCRGSGPPGSGVQWPPGRGMGISPPSCDYAGWGRASPPTRFSRARESIAGMKVTFSMDDAERKVTFSRGTRPPEVGRSGGIMGEGFLRIRRTGVLHPC